jgi:hypothetical protein
MKDNIDKALGLMNIGKLILGIGLLIAQKNNEVNQKKEGELSFRWCPMLFGKCSAT